MLGPCPYRPKNKKIHKMVKNVSGVAPGHTQQVVKIVIVSAPGFDGPKSHSKDSTLRASFAQPPKQVASKA